MNDRIARRSRISDTYSHPRRSLALCVAIAAFVSVPIACSAQAVRLDPKMRMAEDSVAARMVVAAMIGELGEHIIYAARDTSIRPWRITFPVVEGSLWPAYEEIVLRVVRGRQPTAADSSMRVLSLSELQMHGDTLVAYFNIGVLIYCGDRTSGFGTGFVMKAIWHRFGWWSRPETRHAWDSDSLPCERSR